MMNDPVVSLDRSADPPSSLTGGPGQPLTGAQHAARIQTIATALRLVDAFSREDLNQLAEYQAKARALGPLDPDWRRGGREYFEARAAGGVGPNVGV